MVFRINDSQPKQFKHVTSTLFVALLSMETPIIPQTFLSAERLFYFDVRQKQKCSNLIWFRAFGFTC